jgi:2-hydroxy-6-oxonona-2,4-dienedioate hydrolase
MTETVTDAPAEHYIDLKKYRIHYWEAGAGHPVLLLHGGGPGATGWTNYSQNIGPLARHFHVFALDMPGWGDSDTPADDEGYDHVPVVAEFLDAHGIEKAALVGNSMGGLTSIATATLHPDRVSHLVTMGAPAPIYLIMSPAGPTEGIKVLAQAYRETTPANMKRLVETMVYDGSFATDELAEARAAAALAKPEHLRHWVTAMQRGPSLPHFSLGPQIRNVTAPALIIQGHDDRFVPLENALHLVSLIPDSRAVILSHCGHWAQIEHAAEFNRLVTSFISDAG